MLGIHQLPCPVDIRIDILTGQVPGRHISRAYAVLACNQHDTYML
jgi:hypothetical protein